MPIDHAALMSRPGEKSSYSYEDKDILLYNLSIGMGTDPLARDELPFVFEQPALKAVPSVVTVLGSGNSPILDMLDIDWSMVVHGEQRLRLHRPVPPAADITTVTRISEVVDKGPGRGATITLETEGRLADGDPLYTSENVLFARADGGFGGPSESGRAPHRLPDWGPDHSCSIATRPDQALLYRLNGDRNPLHADPAFAQGVGFPRPILHGLCSFGIACRAILTTICDYDPARILSIEARFTKPVFPGETIVTDIWMDENVASFRSRVAERDVTSIDNGRCVIQSGQGPV